MTTSAAERESQNIELAGSDEEVEKLLADFHEVLPWPWRPAQLRFPEDDDFYIRSLNAAAGYLREPVIPLSGARIWVPGCAMVHGVQTALNYPDAQVIGSDISRRELTASREIAQQVDARNLELREESINEIDYSEEFDHIICTGVLHHQADPGRTLAQLARALKPTGVMELMVYNRYHRTASSACQKAVRLLGGDDLDYAGQLSLARSLLGLAPDESEMARLRDRIAGLPDVAVGDALIYPIEYSYTVRTLSEMAAGCGLRLAMPILNQFDQMWGTYDWELPVDEPNLKRRYLALSDEDRWQVTNLLRLERSPMLWFYLQRDDNPRKIGDQRSVAGDFLATVFRRHDTKLRSYVLDKTKTYRLAQSRIPLPAGAPDPSVRDILELVDGERSMEEIFARLGRTTEPAAVNRARIHLTSMSYPYLVTA